MRRDDAWHAARHRLDDRNPEALEPRRVDEDRGPPVERRQARMRGVAELAERHELQAAVELGPGAAQRGKVLAPGLRCGGEGVWTVCLGLVAVGREDFVDTGIRDADPLPWDA